MRFIRTKARYMEPVAAQQHAIMLFQVAAMYKSLCLTDSSCRLDFDKSLHDIREADLLDTWYKTEEFYIAWAKKQLSKAGSK